MPWALTSHRTGPQRRIRKRAERQYKVEELVQVRRQLLLVDGARALRRDGERRRRGRIGSHRDGQDYQLVAV